MYSNYDSERAENNIKFCLNLVSIAAIKYPTKTNLGDKEFISAQFQVTVHQNGQSVTAAHAGEAGPSTPIIRKGEQRVHTGLCSACSPIQSKAQCGIRCHPQSEFKQKQKSLTDELTGQPTLDRPFLRETPFPGDSILW